MVLAIDIDVGRLAQQNTPATAERFDEAAYRDRLIAGGIDPTSAAEVAANTEAARANSSTPVKSSARHFEPRNGDLFDQLTQVGMPRKTGADKKVATVPVVYSTARDLMPPKAARTKRDGKIVAVAVQIASTSPDGFGDFMAFTHAVLCQVGLPRSKVEGREFLRQSGSAWINIQAGILDEGKGPVLQPIPYGVMPRLTLAWVSTFAMRNDTPVIPIGDSAAEFLRLMGMDDQGARYTSLRRQMHALAACRLQMGYKGRNMPNMAPVKQFDAWVGNNDHQRALWPGIMTLSDEYFSELRASAVPLDNRALLALKGSALALDVYAWLAHRLHRIHGRGVMLYWANLREQFAQEYKGKDPDKDFKKEFVPTLKKVLAVYPQAKVKPVAGGVLLLGSPPPIPYKGGPTV